MRDFILNLNNKRLLLIKRILFVVLAIYWGFFGCIIIYRCFLRAVIYPLEYKTEIYECAEEFGLKKTFIFSIVKVESGFNSNAQSSAGAKGLMQMTDGTAKYVAKMMSLDEFDIFDPKTNLRLGCFYIKYLLDRFEIIDTAICAYNAGEGNVSAWLKKPEYSDDGKTLKSIPFAETQEYLKKINETFAKYEKLYGNILDKHKIFE